MGIKRPHSEAQASGDDHMHPSRKRARDDRPHKTKPRKPVDLESMTAIKKRARAIERLLAHDAEKLPAHKKREMERELAAHKRRIADAQYKKNRAKMISKYHMVRFFERKKATRIAKQLEKKLAQATDADEIAKLKTDLHKAEVDIAYAIYYPFMEPYISLYAKPAAGEEEKATQYLHTERPPMWALIEKTREEGREALERLQNRKPQDDAEGEEAEEGGKKGSKKSKSAKAKKDEESDDGGFFEMTSTIALSVPSFYRHSVPKLHRLNVQLGLLPSFAQEFLPRPTLTASKAYRGPNSPQVVRFISIMPPKEAKRKLGQFLSDTIAQDPASPKKLKQKIGIHTMSAAPSTPSPATNDDAIDYQSLASFVEKQMRDPKPITSHQRRLLTELMSSLKDEEPDVSGYDWVSLLQRYTDAHKNQAGTSIDYKDEAVPTTNPATPNTKWTCTLTFKHSREHGPQFFPFPHQVVSGGFAKKKDAKKYAAKCCVEWLMSENYMPNDGIKVSFPTGSKLMMSSSNKIYGPLSQPSPSSSTPTPTQSPSKLQPPPPKPTESALSLLESGGIPLGPPDNDDNGNDDNDIGETPSKRVAALCQKLGLRPPRYVLIQKAGQEGVFGGYADMGADSWLVPDDADEKDFGKVERVYSKKSAKETIAQNVLGLLLKVEREREEESARLAGK
ncbi:hypothetical protein B0T21DRAFT_380431 [Apiosordaria backusii]|uniref:rRNA-processing protein EFG1 n=1 Tax=Apiosordaria backusii TaxID=314023 RepID=A0AA40K7B2_9PEZI|nr:hypothetical protein B0T21DRAFT_380431 [Apiosordaria backusii]